MSGCPDRPGEGDADRAQAALGWVVSSVPLAEAFKKNDEIGIPIFGTEDSREGMKAFKEKRKPIYRGR